MFTQAFQFRKINHQPFTAPFNVVCHNYSFRGRSNKRYLVMAEMYEYNVIAVKYCLQEHKNFDDRFQRITRLNECSRVVTTVGRIMMELFKENPFASFVFVGANSINEPKNNTKRYRLYSKIVENVLSPVLFEHHYSKKLSSYVMLNRQNTEPNLLAQIEERLKDVLQIEGHFNDNFEPPE